MPRPSLLPGMIIFGLLPLSCATQTQAETIALEAPIPSPPAHAPVSERIQYWENRLPRLSRADQSEARLYLGELYLLDDNATQARINFYAAKQGPQSALEVAQCSFGIGRSYMMARRPALAVSHLKAANKVLTGPEGNECGYLYQVAVGNPPPEASSAMLARLRPYTQGMTLAKPASASKTSHDFSSVSRSEWGAASMLANYNSMSPPYRLTVHHTAEPATTHRLEDSYREMRDLQRMHQEGNGWADLGYHFLIDQAGRVLEGRPLSAQGAHAGNSNLNQGNIGICLLGNFVPQPDRGLDYAIAQHPTFEQIKALDDLTDALQARYEIVNQQIWAHVDLRETECPGPYLINWVEKRRL